ncbi:MAG: amino acid adenylation domain-containing protein, partial [Actinobacteria bacterium]|nr:amino acid adenylation domain-containing protein [Actinomycetota bacterium]
MKVQQKFWTECLAKDCQPLNLPTDHPRPAIQTYQSGFLMFLIPENLVSALRKLATNLDASMTTVFLTAFNILLFRYTGQTVVITGAPCPCRSDDRLAEAVGPFANLLVIKANFQDDPTVADMVFQMHQYWDQAMENQQFPFDRLVQAINPDKDMSRTALFDVLFNCREDLPVLPSGPDFSAQIIHTHHGWGKYDLTLGLQVQGQEATGSLVYNKDIFEADTINRMLSHFLTILSQMTCQPDIPVSRLQILTQAEYDYHCFFPLPTSPRWGEESERLPQAKTLHELFADQALRHPDRLAVTSEDERLTYRQLNFRADELARLLNECGIGPDQIVGVCLEKSPDIIVAIIGILKAGGAYLPLDPSLPQERLAFMLQDASVRVILTWKSLQNRFTDYFGLENSNYELGITNQKLEIRNYESGITDGNQLVFLSTIHNMEDAPTLLGAPHPSAASLPIKESTHSPLTCNSASALDNLAYIIYTSGSTGTPKGVLITHLQVVNLMVNDESDFNFSDQDIWTLFHAFSFDFSVWEMFGALLYGGCITIVPHLTAQDPRQFLKLLKINRVTVLNQTPTAFYALIPHIVADFEQGGDPLALRYVIFGGETLAPGCLKPFRDIYPQVKLVNMYGITETTVHVTFKELNDIDIQTNTHAIVRPLPGLRVHVLDKHLQPVPVGVWGELCVAGNGLARGYLNRPELTAKKFTVLPWQPHERIYRSGDLGRWRSDGDLEYLGRADDQVKIRGYRIETREVVHHLLAHPDIKQAVVLPHEDFDGSKSLRAYIVADRPLKAADLRQHLQARLPEYMLPRLFQIPQIPVTANGKVDVVACANWPHWGAAVPGDGGAAIPPGDVAACAGLNPLELEPEDPFQPARNEMEAQMVAVWQAVLGLERISIHDNFFELGGHSLKAAQVVFRLQQILEKEIGLKDFFSAPSISALAAILKQRGTR